MILLPLLTVLAFQPTIQSVGKDLVVSNMVDNVPICISMSAESEEYANCDGSTTPPAINVLDFSCFINQYSSGNTLANCDQSSTVPVLNVLDFACFLNKFAEGSQRLADPLVGTQWWPFYDYQEGREPPYQPIQVIVGAMSPITTYWWAGDMPHGPGYMNPEFVMPEPCFTTPQFTLVVFPVGNQCRIRFQTTACLQYDNISIIITNSASVH